MQQIKNKPFLIFWVMWHVTCHTSWWPRTLHLYWHPSPVPSLVSPPLSLSPSSPHPFHHTLPPTITHHHPPSPSHHPPITPSSSFPPSHHSPTHPPSCLICHLQLFPNKEIIPSLSQNMYKHVETTPTFQKYPLKRWRQDSPHHTSKALPLLAMSWSCLCLTTMLCWPCLCVPG